MESEGGKGDERLESCSFGRVCSLSRPSFCVAWLIRHSNAQQRPSFALLVNTAVASASEDTGPLEAKPTDPEDSDSWLEVSPDELDGLMRRASGLAPPSAGGENGEKRVELGEEHGKALHDLAAKVQEFVGSEGDVQGARFAE